jgi:hypothetical protein
LADADIHDNHIVPVRSQFSETGFRALVLIGLPGRPGKLQIDESSLLGLFGWALVFRSAIGVLVSLLMLPPLVARMNSEEPLLESEFGEVLGVSPAHLAVAAISLLSRLVRPRRVAGSLPKRF